MTSRVVAVYKLGASGDNNMLVINEEMDWLCEKARCIVETYIVPARAKGEDRYIYTLGMLAFLHLYGVKGKRTYIKLYNNYKEIYVGISGQWKDIIVGEEKEGILKIRDKYEVSKFIKALEYKIYDDAYQAAAIRNEYVLDYSVEELQGLPIDDRVGADNQIEPSTELEYDESYYLPIDDMVDLDKEAQIELANKLSISKLKSEYLEAMDKWKSGCKDLKLGGYKCEVDNHPAYAKWQGMLNRAYGASSGKWYDNVTVSESFKHYPIFKQWYLTQYVEEGWELDKDLLVKGNKVYCASRCCFLPKEINSALAINRSLIPMLAEKYRKVLNKDIYNALL